MADAFLGLSDLLTVNNGDLSSVELSNILDKAPVLAAMAADTVAATTHKYLLETAAPTTGFRDVNDGRENTKGTDTTVTVALEILDATFAVDVALADAYKNGKEAYIQRELAKHLRSALFVAEGQIINGTISGDSDGFDGLADTLVYGHAMTLDAAGTTAATGSSVYGIVNSVDEGCALITGMGGNIDVGDTTVARIDGATGTYPAYYTPVTGWLGLQAGNAYSAGRICNLTEDSGKGLTDALIANFLSAFPSGKMPDFLAMNRRSVFQLQASRTATNATGAPAPIPMEAFGVPIIVTDAITSVEALLS